ncbi:hypothetical protein [Streptomyces palmae]|uniref:Uncharacterized protein n=1 Tax=Streptomyces palmae TaxID=1701085 RepID=A0A4Z0HBE7_9ACTN|nr:hypothetical protein [Streptomyces palmae]TGB13234.1 hypothetical protein E4099_10390 [Streptomyces palmae]
MAVPSQPVGAPSPLPPIAPPAPSEVTRLLCAGVYLDADFRRRVIEELVEHEERPVAPSLGYDAVPVLAHALRARRQEFETSLLMLGIWAGFLGVTVSDSGWASLFSLTSPFTMYLLVCGALWIGRAAGGVSTAVYTLDRAMVKQATHGRLKMLLPLAPRVIALAYWAFMFYALFNGVQIWAGLLFPLMLVIPVWSHRSRVASVMCRELSPFAFRQRPRAALPRTVRYQRIGAAIDREQYARLTIYDPFRPFIGAGKPYEPWSFALELKHAGPEDPQAAPITSHDVVELIKPRLEALRTSAAATSIDRLRALEIDEFVYLPVGVHRSGVAYEPRAVAQHVRDAVDEGGEARRHFLRVRVGAWDEQVVVSVLVRVHTQGAMLVLEVVPHVLTPVKPEYRVVDVIAARGEDDMARDGIRALLAAPAATFSGCASAVRTVIAVFRVWLADPRRALPDGPAASVREMGSVDEVSLFQEMDVSRYVKTVQDRIASGVRDALSAKGYQTGEFEKQIINVSSGGVFIGAMSGGAVASGERASARYTRKEGARDDRRTE